MKSSHHILVDEVEDHVCEARAAPVAVDQQQLTEVLKPGDGKVTGHDSLETDDRNVTTGGNVSTHTAAASQTAAESFKSTAGVYLR